MDRKKRIDRTKFLKREGTAQKEDGPHYVNESGQVAIDNELLGGRKFEGAEALTLLDNGCMCCQAPRPFFYRRYAY